MTSTLITADRTSQTVALLEISSLRLSLPQAEIRSLEMADLMHTEETKPFSVGWVSFRQERWPVYCLSQDLSLLVVVPRERRSCVVLDTGAGYIGLLCDSFTLDVQITPNMQYDLPLPMQLADSPIQGLLLLEDGTVACMTDSEQLVDYVTRQVNL